MNRKLYLLSTALLMLAAILSMLSGWRYFLSPVSLFQLGTLLNMLFSIGIGLLLAYMLFIRFSAVWKNRIDITIQATSKHANIIQKASKILLYGYYIILPIIILLLFLGGSVRAEIKFLFFPLLKVLPAGYILFEMSRLIDMECKTENN